MELITATLARTMFGSLLAFMMLVSAVGTVGKFIMRLELFCCPLGSLIRPVRVLSWLGSSVAIGRTLAASADGVSEKAMLLRKLLTALNLLDGKKLKESMKYYLNIVGPLGDCTSDSVLLADIENWGCSCCASNSENEGGSELHVEY